MNRIMPDRFGAFDAMGRRLATSPGPTRVIAEHWTNRDGTEHTLGPAHLIGWGASLVSETTVKCCEIEGDSWEDCLRKFHDHLGWEPWKPMPDEG
jgi:hypothetical protein